MTSPLVRMQYRRLADLLARAERFFKSEENIKLTLVARSPSDAECFIVITADDLPEVIKLLASEAAIAAERAGDAA